MNIFKKIYYKLVAPNHSADEMEKYRDEFSKERIIENFQSVYRIMIGLEFVELSIALMPSIHINIRYVAMAFLVTNGLLFIPTFKFKRKNWQADFMKMFKLQHIIVFNFIALASCLNIVVINDFDFVHMYIATIMIIAVTIYIPVVSLTFMVMVSLIVNVFFVAILSTNPEASFHMIENLIVFTFIAWYLGIKSNQKTVELWYNHQHQMDLNNKLEELNKRDPMTRFYNHESILLQMDEAVAHAHRYKKDLSVLMLDIDDFKKTNDTFGHQEGDKVILEVAKVIHRCVRDTDLIGRYGGEEFLVVFPETTKENANIVSQRICDAVAQLKFDKISMSISGGLAELKDNSNERLLALADERLYVAKHQGKKQIVAYS